MEITDKLALKPTKWEKHKVAFSFEGNTLLYGIIRKDKARHFVKLINENFNDNKY